SADRLRIVNTRYAGNRQAGLQLNSVSFSNKVSGADNDGLSDGCLIAGNTFSGNGGGAIALDGVVRSVLVNNLVYGNRGGGIGLADAGRGARYGSHDNRL